MSRTAILNAAGVALSLAASVAAVAGGAPAADPREAEAAPTAAPPTRIASATTVGDRLLLDLCAPARVVAVTLRSAEGPDAHRYAGWTTLRSLDDVESIVALAPDALLVATVGDPRRVERLRDAGIDVVELTASDGVASLLDDIHRVASLCGVPDGGERYARALERRMSAVARDVPEDARREAIYLSVYGDRYFGGTVGSSYHDVLVAAGLTDAAEGRYRGWPQYAIEQILELDPDVIVAREGMRATICRHPALHRLRACGPGQLVEIDGDLLDDPGPAMLDAAEAIHDAVYPP